MILVASGNGDVGMEVGWTVLARGGSALDAVEAATREVERNDADHTVGLGGYPNLMGEVELDASIMDGVTRRAGAVGALRGYVHAITVARAVMERLPHVLVVGDGAARLAAEIGLETEDVLTDTARDIWQAGIGGTLGADDPAATRMLAAVVDLATDPDHVAGTVNFLAIDKGGAMASAVSTSGWAWKYPGRLGDSPLIGAGNYCDARHGAAACTGFGELAIRAGTARMVVAALSRGASLGEACADALRELFDLDVPAVRRIMHTIAIDAAGNHHAVTTDTTRVATYVFHTDSMKDFERLPRTVVDAL